MDGNWNGVYPQNIITHDLVQFRFVHFHSKHPIFCVYFIKTLDLVFANHATIEAKRIEMKI